MGRPGDVRAALAVGEPARRDPWFDQWLKGRDTGIMDGPPIRYVVPGTDGWRTTEQWPPKADLTELHLHADGRLAATDGSAGSRRYDSATGR
jgi:uncharacterized protein